MNYIGHFSRSNFSPYNIPTCWCKMLLEVGKGKRCCIWVHTILFELFRRAIEPYNSYQRNPWWTAVSQILSFWPSFFSAFFFISRWVMIDIQPSYPNSWCGNWWVDTYSKWDKLSSFYTSWVEIQSEDIRWDV